MREKIKILIIGPTPPPYFGTAVATQKILQNEKLNKKFDLLHLDTSDRRGVENIGRWDLQNIKLAIFHILKLFLLLLKKKVNLTYIPIAQNVPGFLRDGIFILISKLFGKKVVCHLRGSYFRDFYERTNSIMRFYIKFCLKKVDRMIVLCERLKKIFSGLIDDKKISVVPNGLPVRELIRRKGEHFLYLSNLSAGKGVFFALNGLKILDKDLHFKFIFAGNWRNSYDKKRAIEIIKSFKKIDVQLVGAVKGEEKSELMSKSIALIFTPVHKEGMPWVIIEALSYGLPIISTDRGCIPDMVKDGENGFIVKDEKDLAEKIKILLENEELREKMCRKSREIFLNYYNEDKSMEKFIEVFHLTFSSKG